MFGRMHQRYGDEAGASPVHGRRSGLGKLVVMGVLVAVAIRALSSHGAGPPAHRAWHA